ncbi:unnamed protein product [Musa acuminata subsp. burmannicoides]
MASKFFASFGLLIVFCASEARGNLPLSSHQPRRARHDVRELRRGVGWVETDECVAACALDRGIVGISSDALLDADFMRKLCSPDCYHGCPTCSTTTSISLQSKVRCKACT